MLTPFSSVRQFWLVLILACVTTIGLDFFVQKLQIRLMPWDYQILQEDEVRARGAGA